MSGQAYSETVLEHYARPRNLGRLADADGSATVGDLRDEPVQITVALRVAADAQGVQRVAEARFRAFGCSAAIASASMATVLIEGRTLGAAAQLAAEEIEEALGGLPTERRYAPELAAAAVRGAATMAVERLAEPSR